MAGLLKTKLAGIGNRLKMRENFMAQDKELQMSIGVRIHRMCSVVQAVHLFQRRQKLDLFLEFYEYIILWWWWFFFFFFFFWLYQVLVASCRISVAVCGIFSCGMGDLVSCPGNQTQAPCTGGMES